MAYRKAKVDCGLGYASSILPNDGRIATAMNQLNSAPSLIDNSSINSNLMNDHMRCQSAVVHCRHECERSESTDSEVIEYKNSCAQDGELTARLAELKAAMLANQEQVFKKPLEDKEKSTVKSTTVVPRIGEREVGLGVKIPLGGGSSPAGR